MLELTTNDDEVILVLDLTGRSEYCGGRRVAQREDSNERNEDGPPHR